MTEEKPMKGEVTKFGLVAGFIAALCCIGPLLLVAVFGASALSLGLTIGYYGEYFLVAGILFLAVAVWLYAKKKKCCDAAEKARLWKQVGVAIVVMLAVYVALKFLVVPALAPIVYANA